jgi:predicted unusual protein kinase regulating ubiquinone biosynthesis (AarF/ABC1/UbiB family)
MRLLVIAWRLGPLMISFRRDAARWVFWGPPVERSPEFHARRAESLAATLADLGPSFIKLAQLIGARADVIPEPYVSALGSLMDRVPPTAWPRIERTISRSYGTAGTAVFDSINPVPLASASLGQVHEGRVAGRRVAIKVLRPGVDRLIAADVVATRKLLAAARWLFRSRPRVLRALRQYGAVLEEFAYRVGDELDYRREAENAIEIRENFLGTPGIIVPEVVRPLVRQRVLVLEFVEGTPLDALAPLAAEGALDTTGLVRKLIEAYAAMMMIDGLFHADPHPRNLLLAPDGSLVLLDFGMVVRVSREQRRALLDTILAAIRRDPDGITAGFETLGLFAPDATRETVRSLVVLLLGIATSYTTTLERLDLLADTVMATLYESPLELPSSMVYFARTAALIEGIGTRYDPRFNALAVASPVILKLQPSILTALGRAHAPSVAELAAGLTGVLGQSLDAMAARFGFTRRGAVSQATEQFVNRLRQSRNRALPSGVRNGADHPHQAQIEPSRANGSDPRTPA